MELSKHKSTEELIEKFKGFKMNPLCVMLAIPKVKSEIKLLAVAANDRAKEMVKNGVAIIAKGSKVEEFNVGEKIQLSKDGIQMSVVFDNFDEDYNIMIVEHYHIKFAYAPGFETLNIKDN